MIKSYTVRAWCPQCGRVHLISSDFRLNDGPAWAGSVAELYAGRPLPPKLQSLLTEKRWCGQAGVWGSIEDRERIYLVPRPAYGP
jgi:hypothetical protein